MVEMGIAVIAILGMVGGLGVGIVAGLAFRDLPQTQERLIRGGIAMMFGALLMAEGGAAKTAVNVFTLLGLLVLVGGMIWALSAAVVAPKEKRAIEELEERRRLEHNIEQKIAFYDECEKNGIKSLSTKKEFERAILIAKKMKLSFVDVSTLFEESKQLSQRKKATEKYAAVTKEQEAEKKKERQEHASLVRYAGYFGREKRIAMLSDERKECIESAEALRSFGDAVWNSSQLKEKEGDWAILGGVASAIAGPAAGVAVALDEQMKTAQENAQIREQNKQNREIFQPVLLTSLDGAHKNERMAKYLEEKIEEAKTKLVAEDPPSACFERCQFYNTKVSVSSTGTCVVETEVKVKPFMIFDDVPAVIDGTIAAKIYDGDRYVGTAQMVLPLKGIKKSGKLKGMALFCGQAGKTYRVEFAPEKLWAMEQ